MPSRIVHVATLVALSGGGFYLLFVWWPTFLSRLIQPPVHHALLLNTISMAFLIILIPITGALSDVLGRRPLLIFGAAGVLLSAFPLFALVEHANPSSVLAIQFIFTLFISCFIGPVPAAMAEMFPSRTRYSGMGIGYNVSLCLLGGTAPLISTWLVLKTENLTAPACFLAVMAASSLLSAFYLKPGKCKMD
jgi:MHS family proline/betaine transporter-like MFS transporter